MTPCPALAYNQVVIVAALLCLYVVYGGGNYGNKGNFPANSTCTEPVLEGGAGKDREKKEVKGLPTPKSKKLLPVLVGVMQGLYFQKCNFYWKSKNE